MITNVCGKCIFYTPYYIKTYKGYISSGFGYCNMHKLNCIAENKYPCTVYEYNHKNESKSD